MRLFILAAGGLLKLWGHLARNLQQNVILFPAIARRLNMKSVIYGLALARLAQTVLAAEPSRPRGVGPDRMGVPSLSIDPLSG